ncbi:basic salivary proline-rich protein 3-like [Homarus americanus]|uniref:basic salivary proline-rich protein 3-like n=1 Tax=Homarus americanus TaxID=6706 RepID=UPI001C480A7B|nr:basic salivary proline-rich protein 3-like [Homarus americanus]
MSQGSPPSLGGFLGSAPSLRPSQGLQSPLGVSLGTPPLPGGSQKTPASLEGFLGLLLHLGESQGSLPLLGGTLWPHSPLGCSLESQVLVWIPEVSQGPPSPLGGCLGPSTPLRGSSPHLGGSYGPPPSLRGSLGSPAPPGRVTGAPPTMGVSKDPHRIWEGFSDPIASIRIPGAPRPPGVSPSHMGGSLGAVVFLLFRALVDVTTTPIITFPVLSLP